MDFAGALVGRFPGGLAHVNTRTCMLFGSISGSNSAAFSSIGGFMLPEMKRAGYPDTPNVSVTVTAAPNGLVIPPSNIMIVYSLAPVLGLSGTATGLHFGIMLITNLCFALCTPPVGSCLFIGGSVGGIRCLQPTHSSTRGNSASPG